MYLLRAFIFRLKWNFSTKKKINKYKVKKKKNYNVYLDCSNRVYCRVLYINIQIEKVKKLMCTKNAKCP